MKQTFKILLLFMIATITTANANAQSKERRINREELATVQAKHIAGELALDDATTQKFVEAYSNCQREIWALGSKPGTKNNSSEAEVGENIQKRFDHSQKILDIRKKYYAEYSKFLTQAQIEKLYKIERNMKKRLQNKKSNKTRPKARKSRRR